MMVWVNGAKYYEDYKINVFFNDGTSGLVDFKPIIENDKRKIINALNDIEVFRKFRVDLDTICWENGADFAPEFLYEQLKTAQKAA